MSVSFGRFVYQPQGWIFLQVAMEPRVQALHDTTLSFASSYAVPPEHVDESQIAHYSPVERESFLRFGYRYTGEALRPHVTLGRIATGDVSLEMSRELDELFARSGIHAVQRVYALSVYEKGENGAHARTVARLNELSAGF